MRHPVPPYPIGSSRMPSSLPTVRSPLSHAPRALRPLAITLGLALLTPVSLCCAESSPAKPTPELTKAVDALGDSNFRVRTDAEHALRELAIEADITPQLEAFALEARAPEVARRAVRILEWIFLSQPGPRADAAEAALERLSLSDSPASVAASETLLGSARLRESRACAAIEELGGAVVYVDPNATPVLRNQAVAPQTGVGFGPPSVLHYVWLHDNWKGGEEGLWHLSRLSHLPDLVVYNIRGNGLDTLTVKHAASNVPGLDVVERGRACLGITDGSPDASRCVIGTVLEGGAAQRAGLQRNDLILSVDGKQVASFNHLVRMLEDLAPEEEVAVDIERRGLPLTVKVKLTRWQDIQARTPDSVPAPPEFQGPLAAEADREPAPEPPPSQTKVDEAPAAAPPRPQFGVVPQEVPSDGNGM